VCAYTRTQSEKDVGARALVWLRADLRLDSVRFGAGKTRGQLEKISRNQHVFAHF
jgi:hypothetical protein